jgi:hypothetical protein
MVFNATFNNISVISWQSVLLVGKPGYPEKYHRQTLSHNVVLSTPRLYYYWVHDKITSTIIWPPLFVLKITQLHDKQDVARYVVLRIHPTRSFVSNLYISQHSLPENGSQTNLKHRALHKSLWISTNHYKLAEKYTTGICVTTS